MSGGDWFDESNIANSYVGAESCGDKCKSKRYLYWGLDCPRSTDIQCRCTNENTGYDVGELKCKQYTKTSRQECIGPFSSHLKGIEYLHGAEGISSVYSTGYIDIIRIN